MSDRFKQFDESSLSLRLRAARDALRESGGTPNETLTEWAQALAAKVAKAEARANAKLVALAHAIQATVAEMGVSNGNGILGLGGDDSGFFFGNVRVIGSVTKGGGGFAIDHPLNPKNRYLRHSFVESSEMKNIYDGVAVCDANDDSRERAPCRV
jgi:hypothetical protein